MKFLEDGIKKKQATKPPGVPPLGFSEFVCVNAFYFIGLYAEIRECLALCTMVETDHELGDSDSKGDPLVVSPGFTKGMAAVVTPQLGFPAPAFDQAVDAWHCERRSTSLTSE